MEVKIVRFPVSLKTETTGDAVFKIQTPNFWESGIDLRAEICSGDDDTVFYDQNIEACLIFQEYWIYKDKFYFDMNEDGELIVICPPGWDVMIGPEGDLIVYPEGHKFEGIGFWIIEDDFVVQ